MQEARVEWNTLNASDFGHPDWETLYPTNTRNILTPRLACKLFHDCVHIINKTEENPKFLQDRLPSATYKIWKRKQWRKQLVECGKRVACRLALGKGFLPNCVGEEIFGYIVIKEAPELGWRRLDKYLESLPETERDKDYAKVARVVSNDDIITLYRMDGDSKETTGKVPTPGTTVKGTSSSKSSSFMDFKSWYNCFERGDGTVHDHIIHVE